jgi:hypothetical protein
VALQVFAGTRAAVVTFNVRESVTRFSKAVLGRFTPVLQRAFGSHSL